MSLDENNDVEDLAVGYVSEDRRTRRLWISLKLLVAALFWVFYCFVPVGIVFLSVFVGTKTTL